jgi:hypothetical protein
MAPGIADGDSLSHHARPHHVVELRSGFGSVATLRASGIREAAAAVVSEQDIHPIGGTGRRLGAEPFIRHFQGAFAAPSRQIAEQEFGLRVFPSLIGHFGRSRIDEHAPLGTGGIMVEILLHATLLAEGPTG